MICGYNFLINKFNTENGVSENGIFPFNRTRSPKE